MVLAYQFFDTSRTRSLEFDSISCKKSHPFLKAYVTKSLTFLLLRFAQLAFSKSSTALFQQWCPRSIGVSHPYRKKRSYTSFLGSEHLIHLCIQTTEPSVLGSKHGDLGSAIRVSLQGLFILININTVTVFQVTLSWQQRKKKNLCLPSSWLSFLIALVPNI